MRACGRGSQLPLDKHPGVHEVEKILMVLSHPLFQSRGKPIATGAARKVLKKDSESRFDLDEAPSLGFEQSVADHVPPEPQLFGQLTDRRQAVAGIVLL